MAVGIIACQGAMLQPAYIRSPETSFQYFLDCLSGKGGIAGRRQKAACRRQQCAAAVGFDTSTLEYQVDSVQRCAAECAGLLQTCVDQVIQGGSEFSTPAVKSKIEQIGIAVATDRYRTVVTGPAVIGRYLEKPDSIEVNAIAAQQHFHMVCMVFVPARNHNPLMAANVFSKTEKRRLDIRQIRTPVAVFVRPRQ